MTKKIVILLISVVFIFLFSGVGLAQDSSDDAIAFRVMINWSHLSAADWYSLQGFSGSPQSLMVDGYEAVRDGRTVYVNAANILDDNLYTNINLISYNKGAEKYTQDIFGQILKHWKFNTNLGVGQSSGHCVGGDDASGDNCSLDQDCGIDEYCDSRKAQIRRDVRRLADVGRIVKLLSGYNDANGEYPQLSAGTYLPRRTVSTWPSWQETLARDLGRNLPVDPINKLADCNSPYDEVTCWNDANKSFDGSVPDDLNEGSRVYSYRANDSGSFRLCAEMETGDYYEIDFAEMDIFTSHYCIGN